MSAILMFLIGCVLGWMYAEARQEAKADARAAALRGDPPRRLRQRGETRL